MTAEVLSVLEMCTELLPDGEPMLTAQELEEVAMMLAGTRAEVEAAGFPPDVTAFLLRQLDLMAQALREYPLRGAAAFREASDTAAAAWAAHAETLAPYASAPIVQRVRLSWKTVDKRLKRVALIGAAAKILLGGAGLVLGAGHTLERLPPGSALETAGTVLNHHADAAPGAEGSGTAAAAAPAEPPDDAAPATVEAPSAEAPASKTATP